MIDDNYNLHEADQLEITYFTDPLCCWSWGFEPQWRRLLYEFEGKVKRTYCMAGMLPSWNAYNDVENSVSRPIQMGPVWMHAAQLTGMQMHTRLWMEDPPASSYPACIAVKCAMLQSVEAGEKYLRMTREAVMLHGENIAKTTVLEILAKQLVEQHPGLMDLQKFSADLFNDTGLEAFRKDTNQVQLTGISRYPTLLVKYQQKQPILITGYRPYNAFLDAIKHIAPSLQKTNELTTAEAYKAYWQKLTDRELKEVVDEINVTS